MGKAKAIKKGAAVSPSTPTSSPNKARNPGKKYTEIEILNVLQYIIDHYDDWTNRKINQRITIVKALEHYDMKDRTPYAMHFKISRLQFEYKKYGKTIGFSNLVNDMVARILNRNVDQQGEEVDTVVIKREPVSDNEQIIEGMVEIKIEPEEDELTQMTTPDPSSIMIMDMAKETPVMSVGGSNGILNYNVHDSNQVHKPWLNSSVINSNRSDGSIAVQSETNDCLTITRPNCTQMSNVNNSSYPILPGTYTIMEALTADEIYRTKLQEIRGKYQEIRNENIKKETEAIEKLNQSYIEIMYLLDRMEVKMAEMQGYRRINVAHNVNRGNLS